MDIEEITADKKRYLELLLLGDEQEDMIDRYLNESHMFILKNGDNVIGEIVVQDVGSGILEIKNIAIYPEYQKMGYGRKLIEFIDSRYKEAFSIFQVGTGDSFSTIRFYEKCGFRCSHVIKNFFIDNYDHEIYEDGKKLTDMVYLRKTLR